MYESTVNIDILRTTGLDPISFLHDLPTVTGTVSGTVVVSGMWVNNTINDKVVSVVKILAETQELVGSLISSIQEKAELEGFTMYISISEG